MKSCIVSAIIAVSIFISYECYALSEDVSYDPYLKFSEATSLYSESRFEEALKLYEDILGHGYESAALYYNLGNTFLKLGALGKAILYYERALRLAPYDSDLKSNIKYANSLRQEPATMENASLWINRRIDSVLAIFTATGLTKLLSMVYVLVFLFLGIAIFRKGFVAFARRAVITLAVFFMVAVTILSFKIYQTEYMQSAVVLDNVADARYEPLIESPVHFKLYEGAKIVVLKSRGEWSQIKRVDNKIGWIQSSVYGIIQVKE